MSRIDNYITLWIGKINLLEIELEYILNNRRTRTSSDIINRLLPFCYLCLSILGTVKDVVNRSNSRRQVINVLTVNTR